MSNTNLKIYRGIAELEQFTVVELCAYTGLEPSQVYPTLAELKDQGVLTCSSAPAEGGHAAPRHRPINIYRFANEAARVKIVSKLEDVFPQPPQDDTRERQVRELLSSASLELLQVREIASLSQEPQFNEWSSQMKKRMDKAEREIRRLIWEADVDLSGQAAADHPLSKLWRQARQVGDELRRLEEEERLRRQQDAVIRFWNTRIRPLGSVKTWAKVSHRPGAIAKFESALLATMSSLGGPSVAGGGETAFAAGFLAQLTQDVAFAKKSGINLFAVAAKHTIARGMDPEIPLKYVDELASEKATGQLYFDQANLAVLRGKDSEALGHWRNYLDDFKIDAELVTPVLGFVDGSKLTEESCRRVISEINERAPGAITFLSTTPLPVRVAAATFRIEPRVYDPVQALYPSPDIGFISVCNYMLHGAALHMATTCLDRPDILGIPQVGVATWLVRSGLDRNKAWQISHKLAGQNGILVRIDPAASSTLRLRKKIRDILTDSLGNTFEFLMA